MEEIYLFTDGSVNTKSKVGFGAYLAVFNLELPPETLKPHVRIKRFSDTSSTKLELQTLLWALLEIRPKANSIVIYTDSQNIVNLPERRKKLEQRNYFSKNNKRIGNFELYQEFYHLLDELNFKLVKLKGHTPSARKGDILKLFSLVDKASRNAVRKEVCNPEAHLLK